MVEGRPSLPGSSMGGGVLIRAASCLVISSQLRDIHRKVAVYLLYRGSYSLLPCQLAFAQSRFNKPISETYQSDGLPPA